MSNPCSCCYQGCYCSYTDINCGEEPPDFSYTYKYDYGGYPLFYFGNYGVSRIVGWHHKEYPKSITEAVWDSELGRFLGPINEVKRSPPCAPICIYDGMDLLGGSSVPGEALSSIGVFGKTSGFHMGFYVQNCKWPNGSKYYYENCYNAPWTFIEIKSDRFNNKCRLLSRSIPAGNSMGYLDPNDEKNAAFFDILDSEDGFEVIDEFDAGGEGIYGKKSVMLSDSIEIFVGCGWTGFPMRYCGFDNYCNGLTGIWQCNGYSGYAQHPCSSPNEDEIPSILVATKIKTQGHPSHIKKDTWYSTDPWCRQIVGGHEIKASYTSTAGNAFGARSLPMMEQYCPCGLASTIRRDISYNLILANISCTSIGFTGYQGYANTYYNNYCIGPSNSHYCYDSFGNSIPVWNGCENNQTCSESTDCCSVATDYSVTPNKDPLALPFRCWERSAKFCGYLHWSVTHGLGYIGYYYWYHGYWDVGGYFSPDNYPSWGYVSDASAKSHTIPGFWLNSRLGRNTNIDLVYGKEAENLTQQCTNNGLYPYAGTACLLGYETGFNGKNVTISQPIEYVYGQITVEAIVAQV
jgi:hypothetical protein